MRILITGATGFIGQRLVKTLYQKGYSDLYILSRRKEGVTDKFSFPVKVFTWDPSQGSVEPSALEGVSAVFHLAGENIADGRWSESKKKRILNSRVQSTKTLIAAIEKEGSSVQKLISSSAVGIYGHCEENLNEKSPLGTGFLAEVCQAWEEEIHQHGLDHLSSTCLRTGLVLSAQEGALAKMLLPFRLGLGGVLGSGQQWMSWIHIDDLIAQFLFLLESASMAPAYNGTAPHPVRNKEFTQTLGKILGRPTVLPIPSLALKLALGEMSTVLLEGQRALPEQFIKESFQFTFTDLSTAISDLLRREV